MKTFMFSVLVAILGLQAQAATQTHCGWFSNPSPANAWLDDTQGEWIISTQGSDGSDAKGEWPAIPRGKGFWIVPPGASPDYYGYGCACISGTFDNEQKRVLTITKSKVKHLTTCRKDQGLAKIEPSFN